MSWLEKYSRKKLGRVLGAAAKILIEAAVTRGHQIKTIPDVPTVICIADVHGNYYNFRQALISFTDLLKRGERAHFVILGDLIDRGTDSLLWLLIALELKVKWPEAVTYILGNHEAVFTRSWSPEFERRYPGNVIYVPGDNAIFNELQCKNGFKERGARRIISRIVEIFTCLPVEAIWRDTYFAHGAPVVREGSKLYDAVGRVRLSSFEGDRPPPILQQLPMRWWATWDDLADNVYQIELGNRARGVVVYPVESIFDWMEEQGRVRKAVFGHQHPERVLTYQDEDGRGLYLAILADREVYRLNADGRLARI